jgi:hypothetical protein
MCAPGSGQALVCPACGSALIEFFTTSFGGDLELPEQPDTVTCTGPRQHRYLVLQIDTTPQGERLYTLGEEITEEPDA